LRGAAAVTPAEPVVSIGLTVWQPATANANAAASATGPKLLNVLELTEQFITGLSGPHRGSRQ
jgi:hypothetical protein